MSFDFCGIAIFTAKQIYVEPVTDFQNIAVTFTWLYSLGHMAQTFVQTGPKSPQFRRICEFPLLSWLFSESHLSATGDNDLNIVTSEHGKVKLKGKALLGSILAENQTSFFLSLEKNRSV